MTALSTPREYAYAAQAFLAGPQALITHDEAEPLRLWAVDIHDASAAPGRAVALRSWLVYVHEKYGETADVETLQVRFGTRDFDDAIGNVWIPGPRKFTRATNAVQFYRIGADSQSAVDFSTRYFSGLRAVASTPTTWVGFSPDARVVIVYRVTDSSQDARIERSIAEHDAALDANVEG